MKKIIAVILALMVCISAPCFAVEPISASAYVLPNLITTDPIVGPAFPVIVVASASVVGWVGSGDTPKIATATVSRDVPNIIGRYTVIWDCFRGPTIIEEPPTTVLGHLKRIVSLFSAIIIDWIWVNTD